MKQFFRVLLLVLAVAVTVSCASASRYCTPLTSGKIYDSIKTFSDSSGTRTVVLFPMIHLAKASTYKQLNDYLDTLKSHGYITFCEGVIHSDRYTDTLDIPLYHDIYDVYAPIDSMKTDTLSRKLRKLLGYDSGIKQRKIASMLNLVHQADSLQLFGESDYWADVTTADMIREFESRFGEIELSQYDFECPLFSGKYKGKEDKRWRYLRGSLNSYCDDRLAKCVFESDFDKIAVVFGTAHIHKLFFFVLPQNGYVQIDNPYYQ